MAVDGEKFTKSIRLPFVAGGETTTNKNTGVIEGFWQSTAAMSINFSPFAPGSQELETKQKMWVFPKIGVPPNHPFQ